MSFRGISFEQSTRERSITFPVGFRGISFETPANIRFLKVCDFRGIPMPNATVIFYNSGGSITSMTNESGIAQIQPDTVGTVLFDVIQHKTIQKNFSYTFASEGITKTIIIQSSTTHL